MALRLVKAVLAASLLMLLWPTPGYASHGNGLHWRRPTSNMLRRVPVVDKTGDSYWQPKIAAAVKRWNAGLSNVDLVYQRGSGSCGTSSGVIEVCRGTSSRAVWRTDSNRHFRGVAITLSRSPAADAIVCHEIGHALGLGHQGDGSSCMASTVYPGQNNPSRHDFATVNGTHNH